MTDHTPNLEQTAQVIAAHQPKDVRRQDPKRSHLLVNLTGCTGCDWTGPLVQRGQPNPDHAAHVVAVLRDSGLTVIALPEPDAVEEVVEEVVEEALINSDVTQVVEVEDEGLDRTIGERLLSDVVSTVVGALMATPDLTADLIAASLTAQGDNP